MKNEKAKQADYAFWNCAKEEVINEILGSSVHFSAKLSNSNMGGGVAVERYLDLPYLSVSTVAGGQVPIQMAVKNAALLGVVKQIGAVRSGLVGDQFGIKSTEIKAAIDAAMKQEISEIGKESAQKKRGAIEKRIRSSMPKVDVPAEEIERFQRFISQNNSVSDAFRIDHRMKQLIVFDEELGRDVCLTPLRSKGLPELIHQVERKRAAALGGIDAEEHDRIRTMKDSAFTKALKELKERKTGAAFYSSLFMRCDLPIGGAQPQNSGLNPSDDIRSPLIIAMPTLDRKAREVFAIHHKGIDPIGYELASSFLVFFHAEQKDGSDGGMVFKKKIDAWVEAILVDLDRRANRALTGLEQYAEDIVGLPGDQCAAADYFSDELLADPLRAGCVIKARRDNEWRDAYADSVISYLMRIRFSPSKGSRPISSMLSDDDASYLRSAIKRRAV